MHPNVVLYRSNAAASFIPHALLREVDIPHTSVVLTFKDEKMQAEDGSMSHADYKKIHPSGFVPALQVDGVVITEQVAVLTYIAELAPERMLLGSTPLERAKIYEWLVWISGTLHVLGYAALWRPMRFSDDETAHKAIIEKGRKTIMEAYARIEQCIQGLHAVGDRLTVVDFDLHTFWRWGAMRLGIDKEDFSSRFPRYTVLVKRVEKLDSVQQTLKEEEQELAF